MNKFISHIKNTLLRPPFFIGLGVVALLFAISYGVGFLFPVAQIALFIWLVLALVDWSLLFLSKVSFNAHRKLEKILSLGDNNTIKLFIENNAQLPFYLEIIDELPAQLQIRDFIKRIHLKAYENTGIEYEIRPTERGKYLFGNVNLLLHTHLGLVERRYNIDCAQEAPVYPSIIQMKKYSLETIHRYATEYGEQKVPKRGKSYEFDQIKNYVRGDDYRNINWKATSKNNQLMINQFTEERSQRIYCVIDKSRTMKMPFDGLTLLDYSINASLVISNVTLQKQDKAGLLTFSDKIGTIVPADRNSTQLDKILKALYNEKERALESNYELLYTLTQRLMPFRSLLFLFTNFESYYSLERVLPLLRRINKKHLLVVIIFENTEMATFTETKADDKRTIYTHTLIDDAVVERKRILRTLEQYGIQTIITQPENLSINLINKYLRLKKTGQI